MTFLTDGVLYTVTYLSNHSLSSSKWSCRVLKSREVYVRILKSLLTVVTENEYC